jgi:hypothetical protein
LTESLELAKIGINEASTFPGYCLQHERHFEKFEQSGFLEPKDFLLQTYRTICREVVRNKHTYAMLQAVRTQYLQYRQVKMSEFIRKDLGEAFLRQNNIALKGVEFEHRDYKIQALDRYLNAVTDNLKNFLYKIQTSALNDARKAKSQKTATIAINADFEIPVALAGTGNFFIRKGSKIKSIPMVINVLPYPDKTHISMVSFKSNGAYLQAYISQFRDSIAVVGMVERWMLHGSDHWFIRPSVWEDIPLPIQAEISDAIWDTSKNIGDPSNLSIFSSLKRHLFDAYSDNPPKFLT